MMNNFGRLIRVAMPCRFISPHGFFAAAVVLTLVFAACHALGWREYAAFLSGNRLPEGQTAMGMVYVLAYFSFVIIAPIMVFASAIFWLFLRPWRRA